MIEKFHLRRVQFFENGDEVWYEESLEEHDRGLLREFSDTIQAKTDADAGTIGAALQREARNEFIDRFLSQRVRQNRTPPASGQVDGADSEVKATPSAGFKPAVPGMNYCECDEPDEEYGNHSQPYCKKCGCWILPKSRIPDGELL